MPNIWKFLTRPQVEPYRFPDASELVQDPPKKDGAPPPEEEGAPQAPEEETEEEAPTPSRQSDPVGYAQIQAERILQDAKRRAGEILAQAKEEAQAQASEVRQAARQEGFQAGMAEGAAQGMQQALAEGREARERQAAAQAEEVGRFLEDAGAALDRQMDDNVEELRDLAIAIAEKVVRVSLKSSSEVIGRMIQAAIDKRTRRDWAHIYIAECDAKHVSKISASLMPALSALSSRVRIIPMADDESGTCIIETPDEIVDASAATQLDNIRTLLSDAPAGTVDGGSDLGGGAYVPADDPASL